MKLAMSAISPHAAITSMPGGVAASSYRMNLAVAIVTPSASTLIAQPNP
jgi:hypothetical protein